jgi:hypothetical protein
MDQCGMVDFNHGVLHVRRAKAGSAHDFMACPNNRLKFTPPPLPTKFARPIPIHAKKVFSSSHAQNWFESQIFKYFDDIVNHCGYACNTSSISRGRWFEPGRPRRLHRQGSSAPKATPAKRTKPKSLRGGHLVSSAVRSIPDLFRPTTTPMTMIV